MSWLQAMDIGGFRFINHTLSNPFFDVIMPWLSGNALFLPLTVVAALWLVWQGRARAALMLVVIAAAIGVTDGLVCNTLKHALARPRPCLVLDQIHLLVGCSESGSLPSSHAANWFAGTMVAFLFGHRLWRFALPLAIGVSFSRVYNGVHYPSDVLVGAILGAGSGLAVTLTLNAIWRFAGRRWFPIWHERFPGLTGVARGAAGAPPADAQQAALNQHWLRLGYVVLFGLTIARWFYLAGRTIELSEDEAYQWVWSKHLALSYYSKPPLIALAQWVGTSLWGDTTFGVRFLSPLIAATIGVTLLRFFAREVNARAGFFLVLIVTTTPLLSLGATLLTVDPLAVLFWTAALLSGWRAIQEDSPTSAWLWTGLWMGLGFLSKYSSPLQWMCWAVFFIVWPAARQHLRRPGPYLALGVNLLCTVPVLIWNAQHDWITVKHVASHGGAGQTWQPTMKYLIEYLGGECALLNPIYFVAALAAAVLLWRQPKRDTRLVYFFSMGTPVFVLYALLALKSRVQANWIAPCILPMFCVMVFYWEARLRAGARFVKPFLVCGVALGLLMVGILLDTNLITKLTGHALPGKIDPTTRVRANRAMVRSIEVAGAQLATEGRPVFYIGDHYGITSLMNFYLPAAQANIKTQLLAYYRPTEKPDNQYFFWPGYAESRKGQSAIYASEVGMPKLVADWFPRWLAGDTNLVAETLQPSPTPDFLTKQFTSVTPLGFQEVYYRGQIFHIVELFECRNLR